jgi:DNA invertase Pin-like site-specific DNA recombinase
MIQSVAVNIPFTGDKHNVYWRRVQTIFVRDRVVADKASRQGRRRATADETVEFAPDGGTVVADNMDRLARHLYELFALVQGLTRKGVRVEFVKESLVLTGEDSPKANLMLSVMGAFAEFEHSLIRERQW